MSLVVTIAVNDDPVELLAIRRTAGGDAPDDVNPYEVRRFDLRNAGVRQVGDAVEVVHRYGDGAAALAHEALGAVLRG